MRIIRKVIDHLWPIIVSAGATSFLLPAIKSGKTDDAIILIITFVAIYIMGLVLSN
jgi:hypothetical protein